MNHKSKKNKEKSALMFTDEAKLHQGMTELPRLPGVTNIHFFLKTSTLPSFFPASLQERLRRRIATEIVASPIATDSCVIWSAVDFEVLGKVGVGTFCRFVRIMLFGQARRRLQGIPNAGAARAKHESPQKANSALP